MARKNATSKDLIQAATIARVTSKEGKFLGFLVKSNTSNEYYQTTGTRIGNECVWTCTCKAGQNGFANCKPDADGNKYCCHVHACRQLVALRKARTQAAQPVQAEQGEATQAVAQAERIVKEASAPALDWRAKMERAPLTSNSGFSLMR